MELCAENKHDIVDYIDLNAANIPGDSKTPELLNNFETPPFNNP